MNVPCSHPKVAVLLATHNGARYLSEQIESVLAQELVNCDIYISDDNSTDGTQAKIERHTRSDARVIQLQRRDRFGSASANFFRLIADVELLDYEYFSLADQDDIWDLDKLYRGIQILNSSGAAGYSSSVIAFWPDGREKVVKKSSIQREYDYYFEGPGPGCTFVLRRDLVESLQQFISRKRAELSAIYYHDWFIYAFARANGFVWHIDTKATMRYRQHDSNDTGVNSGLKAVRMRVHRIWTQWARDQVYMTAHLLGYEESISSSFSISPVKLLTMIFQVKHYRRTLLGRLALYLAFVTGRVRRPSGPYPNGAAVSNRGACAE
jgi:rhamnosyltransferase